MDRCALFVDASYVLADGALAVHGTRNRESVSWDYAGLLKFLGGLSRDRTGLPLLRCYWYDSAADGNRAAEHDSLADVPGVKLRLSKARPNRKEGVEAEIRKDLTALARNRAITDVIIVSGEEDLAPVIAEVQDLGIRAILLHISADGDWAMSRSLRQECDDIIDIAAGHLRPYVDLIHGAEPDLAASGYRELRSAAAQVSGPHQAMDAPAARLYGSPVPAEYERAEPQLVGLATAGGDQREQVPGQDVTRFGAQAGHGGQPEGTIAGHVSRIGDQQPVSQQYFSADTSRGQPATAAPGQAQGGFARGGFEPHDSGNGQLGNGQLGQAGNGQLGQAGNGQLGQAGNGQLGQAGLPAGSMQAPGGPIPPGTPGQPNGMQAGVQTTGIPGNGLPPNGMPANGQSGHGGQPTGHLGGSHAQGSMQQGGLTQGGMPPGPPQQGGMQPGGGQQGGMQPGGGQQGGMHSGGIPGNGLGQNGVQHQSAGPLGGAGPQGQSLSMPPGQFQGAPPQGQGMPGPGQHSLQRPGGGQALPPVQSPGPAAAEQPRQQQPSHQRQLPAGNGMQYPQDRGSQYGGPAPQSPYGNPPVPTGYPAGPYGAPPPAPMPAPPVAISVGEAVQSAHAEGFGFGEAVARDAPALWLEAVLARKPRMPSDLEARLLQGSALPIDSLLHDEVRHALRRGFWDALERSRH
ncbi:MAG TPA: NYN domain-containing protein [Streptosporangiaceae bacterium]